MTNKLVKTSTELQKFNRVEDLPEDMKYYTVVMMDKNEYTITGETKQRILRSATNFVEIDSGDVLNKAVISQIRLNKSLTKDKYGQSNSQ